MSEPDSIHAGHLLLFNPGRVQGHRLHRDTYCTSSTKGPYLWQPAEFSVLAQLWPGTVQVEDAMADLHWSSSDTKQNADTIVALIGGYSALDDIHQLDTIAAAHPDATLLAAGEATLSPDEFFASFPRIDGILTRYPGALESEGTGVGIQWRDETKERKLPFRRQYQQWAPWKHQSWQKHRSYKMPWHPRQFASLLLRFGCPFSCNYCNSGTLPYHSAPNFDRQALSDLLQSIASSGVRSLYIRDFSFGPTDRDIVNICTGLQKSGLPWTSFIRPERINKTTIQALAASNCRGLQIGIESTDQQTGKHSQRTTCAADIENAVHLARQHNIPVGGHFVLGIPEDTLAGLQELVAFGSRLPMAYASWNHYVPRAGTAHFNALRAAGKLPENCFGLDSGMKGATASFHPTIKRAEMESLVRSAKRRFYRRPGQWLRTGKALLPRFLSAAAH